MQKITRREQRKNQLSNSLRHLRGYTKEFNIYTLHQKQQVWATLKAFEIVTEDIVVADFGCLDGSVAYEMSKRCRHSYGFDLPQVINQCMYLEDEKLTYLGVDLDKIFPVRTAGHYDLILAIDVIEHLCDPENFLRRCTESMYEYSQIIISTPLSEIPGMINQDPSRQTHFREYTLAELTEVLYKSGIQIEDSFLDPEENQMNILGRKR
jgi:2-polyprenyl-3-methyl-5-hydroxy-6-metoxy-1,4-benzoquinol methylase